MLLNTMISNLLYLRAILSLQRSLKHPYKICVGNNTSGMNLCYSDQVSLVIHIPISIYVSGIFKNKKGVVAFICSFLLI